MFFLCDNMSEELEKTLTLALKEMSMYYKENHLRLNLNKTQTYSP